MANAATRRPRPKYLSLGALLFEIRLPLVKLALLVLEKYLRSNPEDAELARLLELPDNERWNIVSGRSERYDDGLSGIVARLRAS